MIMLYIYNFLKTHIVWMLYLFYNFTIYAWLQLITWEQTKLARNKFLIFTQFNLAILHYIKSQTYLLVKPRHTSSIIINIYHNVTGYSLTGPNSSLWAQHIEQAHSQWPVWVTATLARRYMVPGHGRLEASFL